jgi:hypothetical protein
VDLIDAALLLAAAVVGVQQRARDLLRGVEVRGVGVAVHSPAAAMRRNWK